MKKKFKILIAIFAVSLFAQHVLAQNRLAFLEMQNLDGKKIELEPGGRFAHVAICLNGVWMHSFPNRGVTTTTQKELESLARQITYLNIDKYRKIKTEVAYQLMNKPYDFSYSWNNDEIYSSEFVAKILAIQPKPMTFHSGYWAPRFKGLRGQLGISPDEIFHAISYMQKYK